ncbi:MAG: hypothetical protein M1825_000398 [Sarcosagium campestre]|nr:MAG: hypothetical protein M1825_000398 [Sarcosagium campestre]
MLSSNLYPYLLLGLIGLSSAHGNHDQAPLSEDPSDWATTHMAEEHHISNFDPGAFFSLHDFDNSESWTSDEILRTYGLEDPSMAHVSEARRHEVVIEVLKLLDKNHNGIVERDEWMDFCKSGGHLPDFGLGPGHHGDDEYEYEIHHFEKYHDEYTKEEDLTHPEDIEHFKKHDKEQDDLERQEKLDAMPIAEQNIPAKFRRSS